MKKIILMTSVMLWCPLFVNETRADSTIVDSGTCNNSGTCLWKLDEDGKLTIYAKDNAKNVTMADYQYGYDSVNPKPSTAASNALSGAPWSNGSYEDMGRIKSIVVEEGINNIGDCAFLGAYNLTSVSMPYINTVNSNAFKSANHLTSVDMQNATWIQGSAFTEATALENVNMKNVQDIGSEAFRNTYNLEEIDIPNVHNIRKGAFNHSGLNYASFPEIWYDNDGSERDVSISSNAFVNTNISNCSTNHIDCTICNGNTPYYNGTGCVTDCGSGTFVRNGFCVDNCGIGYKTEERQCIKQIVCSAGKLVKNNTCINVSACTGEYIVDSANNACIKMPGCVDYANGACGGCENGYYKKDNGCVSAQEGCGSGYLEKDSVCISSANGCGAGYKDMGGWCNRIQYTPAEAAPLLNDDNNTVTITFRK